MLIQYIHTLFPVPSYTTRCGILITYCILTGWLLHRVAKRTTAGSLVRTLTCIPVILGNLLAPLLFSPVDDLLTYCLVCFVVLWLASFKVRCSPSHIYFLSICGAKQPCMLPGTGGMARWRASASTEAACATAWTSYSFQRPCGRRSHPRASCRVRSLRPQPSIKHPSHRPLAMLTADDPGAHADPLNDLGSKQSAGMPRVMSNSRLDEEGGSRGQLLAGFLAKSATLGTIVYLLGFETPRLLTEIMYGELLCVVSPFMAARAALHGGPCAALLCSTHLCAGAWHLSTPR